MVNVLNNDLSEIEKLELVKQADFSSRESQLILIDLLKQSSYQPKLMHYIAALVSDAKLNMAVPYLVDIINNPKYINDRGGLIYSLIELDCQLFWPDMIRWLCTGNFETRQMSFFLLQKYSKILPKSVKKRSIALLKKYYIKYKLGYVLNSTLDESEILNTMAFIQGALRCFYQRK